MERIHGGLDELIGGMSQSEKMAINNLHAAEMAMMAELDREHDPDAADRLACDSLSHDELMARVLKLIDSMEELEKDYCKFLLQLLYQTAAAAPQVEVAVDEQAEVHLDQFSLTDHYSDSGYACSSSSFSNVSEFSSYTDELRHNEQCHFGFLVTPQLLREPVQIQNVAEVQSAPTGMKEDDIISWLNEAECHAQKLSGSKRKHENEYEDVIAYKYSSEEPDTKRRRASKSTSLHNVQRTYDRDQTSILQSSSDSCLI